eukprot:RCo052578
MNPEKETLCLISYFAREGLHRHIQSVCNDAISKRGEDPIFRFWKAWAIDMEGSPTEALREYSFLDGKREVQYALNAAMLHAHKRCKLTDQEAVRALEERLQDKNAPEQALLLTAMFYWHSGDFNTAREFAEKVPDYQDEYFCSKSLRGWIDLSCDRTTFVEKSINYFNAVVVDTDEPAQGRSTKKDVEAVLGKAQYLEMKKDYNAALELLNRAVVYFPTFIPALIVKAKILIKAGDWEHASEIAQRVLNKTPSNLEATLLSILFLLVRECRPSVVVSGITDLMKLIDQQEPKNPRLYYKIARAFARLSSGNPHVIQMTQSLVERAHKLEPGRSDYLTELGYQCTLLGEINTALSSFKKASQVDEGNVAALIGVIRCQLAMGKLDDAEQQLEFLLEIQASMGKSPELLFLTGVLKWRKHNNRDALIEKLDEAVSILSEQTKDLVPSLNYYAEFNPQFLLEIIREYLQHCPTEPADPTDPPSPVLEKVMKPIELLVRSVPGSLDGQLLSARVKFASGQVETAQITLSNCLRLDPSCAEAHLLSAQIAFNQENYTAAQQALEQALSLDFQVRDSPQYNLLKARVYGATGEYDEALIVLEHALQLAKASRGGADSAGKRAVAPLNQQDHVSIYLELSQTHLRLKNTSAAQKVIQEALGEFRKTKEEGRIMIANAMITAKKDVDQALGILRAIPATSQYFLKARAQMANLYLHQKNNKRAFAKCYEELVEAYPSVSSYVFLGEAYMSIQEPEKAIAAFEKASALDSNDAELAAKIGKALVTTHDYNKAITYYRNVISGDPTKIYLRHDLATLQWRLGAYDKAETVLKEALQSKKAQAEDVPTLTYRIKTLLLLAKVHKSSNDFKAAIDDLIQAKVFQITVLNKSRGEQPDVIVQQRSMAANICYELGELYSDQRLLDKATSAYGEALKHDETHDKSMLALAKLYLRKGELDGCELQCNALLRVDPSNEEATMMLADLMFRKNKFEDAIYHFQQLLEKKPNNYEALVQFVQLLRRAGRLYECPKFFKAAEKALNRARMDPGLHYAKGLFYRYSNNPREALRELNLGRHPKDGQWSVRCIVAMIEIYLNPDNDNIWEDAETTGVDVTENVKTAEKLLKEVTDRNKKALLEAYCLIATKRKENMEKAMTKFYEIMTNDRSLPASASTASASQVMYPSSPTNANGGGSLGPGEKVNVPCLVGMATALQMMKQTPKARNHLKRVAKAVYTQEEADDFERGWLLLADIYIAGGKFDLAQDLLKKALQVNKSCGRAWEFMGLIYEKEQSYRDAADCYENAWRLVNESDPGIGYKLAFNYLKAKRYVNAIDVCQKVLTQHPQYPRIKKDILDKARGLLRP